MSPDQAIAFGIIIGTIGLFVWGRIAYDLVALLALLAGIVTGVVPADKAFEGFSDEIVIIIVAALLISAAIARSGIVEPAYADSSAARSGVELSCKRLVRGMRQWRGTRYSFKKVSARRALKSYTVPKRSAARWCLRGAGRKASSARFAAGTPTAR
jgi:hypothetical protein